MVRRPPALLAADATKCLRQIEEQLSDKDRRLEIGVPPGVVRTVNKIKSEYGFVSHTTMQRNICYAIEALDFYRWIINRFKLYGPVASYLHKTGIILVNMIVEALIYDFLRQKKIRPSSKHKKNIGKLQDKCGAPKALCDRIDRLRERRSNIHLYLVSDLEADKYNLRDWNTAVLVLRDVRGYLDKVKKGSGT